MKTQSAALAAHRAGGTTTLACCWKITRRDGQVFGFTSVDQDITFAGQLYQAATGFTPSAMQANADLSVANLEVTGMLDAASITEADLLAGRWDGAAVEIFEVNYKDLTMGRMILRTGTLGQVTAGRVAFHAELRGLTQQLQQPVGSVYAAACDATFGDARCGLNAVALQVVGTVTTVTDRRTFGTALGNVADYFGAGLILWNTGANAGLSMEVRDFGSGGFILVQQMPFAVAVGDTFTATPGCRHRRTEDCVGKWANVVNFRGFPDLPQNDLVLGNAGSPVPGLV